MNLSVTILRIYRGLTYYLSYLILELPRGLDISLRSKANGITLQGNHGYALTSKSALKNMLRDIPLKDKSLLDIGSGKGGAVIYAHQLGCKRAAGIEYEKFLHDIAVKNFSILKLNPYCESFNMDARVFLNYACYDILFMFNPFDDDIYDDVVRQLASQILRFDRTKDKYLICYGGANIDAVNKTGLFSLVREDRCPHRGNMFRVFKTVNHAEAG